MRQALCGGLRTYAGSPTAPPFSARVRSSCFCRDTEHNAGRTLIIDAKYYGKSMAAGLYGGHKLHSANLYQICAYVKNSDRDRSGNVAGLLLYAGTDEAVRPGSEYIMDGNVISARTLDLNRDFTEIRRQLDAIAHMLDRPFISGRQAGTA